MRSTFMEPGQCRTREYQRAVVETALAASPLFAGVSSCQITALSAVSWIKKLGAGERLYFEGEASRGLYVVQSGAVRLFRVNASGHEQVVHIARARESFAEESIFTECGYPLNAAAVQATQLIVVPRRELLALLKTCPELLLKMSSALSRHMCEVIALVDDLRLKSARVRLGKWLLHQCADDESEHAQVVNLSLPKKVVAAELGMASETFSRVLAELQAEHLVAVQGRTLVLASPRRLLDSIEWEENHPERERGTFEALDRADWARESVHA